MWLVLQRTSYQGSTESSDRLPFYWPWETLAVIVHRTIMMGLILDWRILFFSPEGCLPHPVYTSGVGGACRSKRAVGSKYTCEISYDAGMLHVLLLLCSYVVSYWLSVAFASLGPEGGREGHLTLLFSHRLYHFGPKYMNCLVFMLRS